MATETTTVVAPAKLTLSLRITGVRDDGFHLIDAEMVSLDLADRLTIAEGDGVEIVGVGGDEVVSRRVRYELEDEDDDDDEPSSPA
jgi:4-diphosphocytidyl-2C-methyl-D-erythritol kinase